MKRALLALALTFIGHSAWAAEADLFCLTGTSSTGAPIFVPASTTTPCPFVGTVTIGGDTIVTLDVKTVTTGGTAVTALVAGNKTHGGWISNPGAVPLCINEIGVASGTTSSGDTTCIEQGRTYYLAHSTGAVSVVSSDNTHPFSGYGLK